MAAPTDDQPTPISFKKPSLEDVCFRYMPVAGGASYLAFSWNIMEPRSFSRVFYPLDMAVANSFWFNSHLGIGLWLFSRKHLRNATTQRRVMFSVFGSVMFNFGAVLIWATSKSFLPNVPALRIAFGALSGVCLCAMGKEYLEYVDANCKDVLKDQEQ